MTTQEANDNRRQLKNQFPINWCSALPRLQLFWLLALGTPFANATDSFVIALSGNGVLSWTNQSDAVSYKVLWAPTVEGPWSDSWTNLVRIPATGEVVQVAVPMFYRVARETQPNNLLLHGDGSDQSVVIEDSVGHVITRQGDTHVSTATSRFGGASLCFDGNGDYLTSPAVADWVFGTGDFTIDCWINFASAPGTIHIIGQHTSGIFADWLLAYEQGNLEFFLNSGIPLSQKWSPLLSTWYHVAVTRSGGTLRLFVDGKLLQSAPGVGHIQSNRLLTIGAADNPSLFFNGYLDEIRIAKGRAAWTNDFSPPTVPY